MAGWFREEGLVSDRAARLGWQNAGNPHYLPGPLGGIASTLSSCWISGKLERPARCSPILRGWVYGPNEVPERFARAFGAVISARDAAVYLV